MLTYDDGHQPIAKGHLSDSGDLKCSKSFNCCRIENQLPCVKQRISMLPPKQKQQRRQNLNIEGLRCITQADPDTESIEN